MKKNITYKIRKTLSVSVPLLVSLLLLLQSCADNEMPRQQQEHNFAMSFETRSANVADIIRNMQLYTFHNNSASSSDKHFHRKILNITRTASQISAPVEAGFWHMAMVAPPTGVSIIEPVGGAPMSQLPMYKYAPTYSDTDKRHPSAPEIFFVNETLNEIKPNQTESMSTRLDRNVAKVILNVAKTTPNFTTGSTVHEITLENVPSTISYTGELLPNKATPTTLASGIRGHIELQTSSEHQGYYCNKTPLEFIIPAHRDLTASDPKYIPTNKMIVKVKMQRQGGGSYFEKQEEIPFSVLSNHILQVNITINDGILFEPVVKRWDVVDMTGELGDEGYTNWVYVKYNVNGTGQSWSDPAPGIKTAISRAEKLIAAGKTVNGILVAAGDNDSQYYNEENDGIIIPQGIKIFGGWSGTPGTELGINDTQGPYTSTARELTKKPILWLGPKSLVLSNNNTVFDGFKILSSANNSQTATISVANATASINAIEISDQTGINAPYALAVSNGIASNILVSRNSKGISVTGSGKIINATVVENTGGSILNGATVYNTIFWPSNPTMSGTNNIQYSAFIGDKDDIPVGTGNIHINSANTAWFSGTVTAPGPHFKLSNASDRYHAISNRAPMLGRGNEEIYTTNLGSLLDKDINGNKRYDTDPQETSKMLMDIGCYEDNSSLTGFRLTWATDRLYLSAKGGYTANLPLMLPGNADPDTEIDVTCTVTTTQLPGTTWSTFEGFTPTSATEKVVVGTLKFKNYGETPDNDYKTTGERQWGTVNIATSLGGYLPNTEVQVWQMSGSKATWTNGYVGSFHRNGERGARYISGANPSSSAYWEVRIISGLDWIKIDNKGKDEGASITDSQEGRTPSNGYYKEVEETWGGVIKASAETRGKPIRFRVGMKSKNTGKPRYGLIVITYGTTLNVAGNISNGSTIMFFVRQGEEPDIIYTENDSRRIGGVDKGRLKKYLTPFTVYNLTAPAGTTNNTNGVDLSRGGTNKATFVKYPTQIGYYFRFNTTQGYPYGKTTSMNSTARTSYSSSFEVCPTDYRHPAQEEYMYTIYDRAEVNETVTNRRIEPGSEESKNNYMLGAYADGYYDQLAADPVGTSNTAPTSFLYNGVTAANAVNESTPGAKGILMVSHFNYASVFFPVSGTLSTSGAINNDTYAMYSAWLDIPSGFAQYYYRNTHWDSGHIGMNCTSIGNRPAPVRCVKATNLP